MIALDASALLAFLFRERGSRHVAEVIDEACLSTVNLSEVLVRFARDGMNVHEATRQIAATTIEIVSFSAHHAQLAAELLPVARPLGLSLGDRACLALAQARDVPAVTADRAWRKLDVGIELIVIR
jgi:PIN domain nuclease of toxin-antitoxin system